MYVASFMCLRDLEMGLDGKACSRFSVKVKSLAIRTIRSFEFLEPIRDEPA